MNKKGFVSTSIIYTILIVIILIITAIISVSTTNSNIIGSIITRTKEEINSINIPNYTVTLNVIGGECSENVKTIEYGKDLEFIVSSTIASNEQITSIKCNNNNATYENGIVTINNVKKSDICSLEFGNHKLTFNDNKTITNSLIESETQNYKAISLGREYNIQYKPLYDNYTFLSWTNYKTIIGYKEFNGNEFITIDKSYKYTDKISIHLEAYMDNWAQYKTSDMRLISCTETGGWSIQSSEENIKFTIYDSGVGYKSIITSKPWASLSSGWHSFDLVFNGTNATAYVDNEPVGASANFTSGQIGYNKDNTIFIGAEAGKNETTPVDGYFNGKIKNLVIENISDRIILKDIKSNDIIDVDSDQMIYAKWMYNEYNYNFVGGEERFYTPINGYYKLEVWGAQGGNVNDSTIGGLGGYSTGIIYLNEGVPLYINVGGNPGNSVGILGGYNGGGSSIYSDAYKGRAGGGATHIALSSGLLKTFENKQNELLIVAGGGGGAGTLNGTQYFSSGGHAGGYKGNSGTSTLGGADSSSLPNCGGTQTEGGYNIYGSLEMVHVVNGTFGQGGSGTLSPTSGSTGGGGGYYGGSGGPEGLTPGGGGSGYIGNNNLTNKLMYCYNCEISTQQNTKTYTTTCNNNVATSNCAKQGNGYAKITYIGDTNE